MGFCRTSQILFSFMLCFINVFGQMNFIEVRLVNETDIIGNISFTTITSSLMKCSEHEECSVIGFTNDPTVGRNSDCLLLKKAESSFTEEAEGLVPLFVIMNDRRTVKKKPVIPECLIHGGWSSWGPPSTCSTTCGPGTSVVTRTCTNPAPQRGGFDCKGNTTQYRSCKLDSCPAVHGGWSSWGSPSACSKSCGLGTSVVKRTCTNPAPQHGGDICDGSDAQARTCVSKNCPADYCKQAIQQGKTVATIKLYTDKGSLITSSSVHCIHKDGFYYTAFKHNRMSWHQIDISNYQQPWLIEYSPASFDFVKMAVPYFSYCHQSFDFNQNGNHPPSSRFRDRNNMKFAMTDSRCKKCPKLVSTQTGSAFITDRTVLPLRAIRMLDNDNKGEYFKIFIRQLLCR